MNIKTIALAAALGVAAGGATAQQTQSPSTPVVNVPDEGARMGNLGGAALPALIALLVVGALGSGGGS